jgi:hypothetical protein
MHSFIQYIKNKKKSMNEMYVLLYAQNLYSTFTTRGRDKFIAWYSFI